MFNRITKITFCTLFIMMLVCPLLTTNLKKDIISEAENRTLAQMPEIYNEDGTLNQKFATGFEEWINDNIGFRSEMVVANAKIQYYLFDVLANNSDMYLGPNGELNYATKAMLKDYQHLNLYSEETLLEIADSFQTINDYLEEQRIQFYYYQCWDKHSIYPEYFPDSVIQYGDMSKTDYIIEALEEYTTVKVISSKQELIDAKGQYTTYSIWGDPTHWTQRGAYIGYLELMSAINADSEIQYKVLQESDYDIIVEDQGETVFGGIHEVDEQEKFVIKNRKAVPTKEKLTLYSEYYRHRFYTNDAVDNDTRLLVIGDSYINSYLIDDLSESFYETILLWEDYCIDLKNLLDEYDPDIVIIESAEREDRFATIIEGAKTLK